MASSALLKQIQAGTKLKRAVEINDRSAPQVDTTSGRSSGAVSFNTPSSSGGGPSQLAGLFSGGMPKLKPTGQSKLAVPPTLGKSPSVPNRSLKNLPFAPVPARLYRPSCANDMGSSAPIHLRQASPAVRSESPTTPRRLHQASLISRSVLTGPTFRNPSPPTSKAKETIPTRAPPPPLPKPSIASLRANFFTHPLQVNDRPFHRLMTVKPPVPRCKVLPPPPGFQ